jgi:hypothetical protein
MRMTSIAVALLLAMACGVAPAQVSTEKVPAKAVVRLKGTPQGGGLHLWIKGRIVAVPTRAGEDLAQVAKDAAAKINADAEIQSQGIRASSQAHEIRIGTNEVWVYLCAMDKGLDVPQAPSDLKIEKRDDGVTYLSWKNPPGGYDRIHILRGTVPIADGIDGTNTTFGDYAAGEKPMYEIFGVKGGTPSCGSAIGILQL